MARLKNVSGSELDVYAPVGHPASLAGVADGQIVEVPGEIVAELDDAYQIGEGDHARLWPKAQWQATSKLAHEPVGAPPTENSPAE